MSVLGVNGIKSNVAADTTSKEILAPNGDRQHFQIWNDSAAWLYLDETGGTASATSCTVPIPPGQFYENTDSVVARGRITGVWGSATGAARATEWE